MPEDNKKNTKSAVIASSILAVAAGIWLWNLRPTSSGLDSKWMYDFASQKLVEAPYSEPSPSDRNGDTFEIPGLGPAGSLVEAGVYSCGECADVDAGMDQEDLAVVKAHVAYYVAFDPTSNARRVAKVDSKIWFNELSSPGIELVTLAEKSCPGGGKALYCFP